MDGCTSVHLQLDSETGETDKYKPMPKHKSDWSEYCPHVVHQSLYKDDSELEWLAQTPHEILDQAMIKAINAY